MKTTSEILFLLSATGTLNGLILATYLFLNNRGKSVERLFLSILLCLISIRIGKSTLLFFNPHLAKTYLQIGISACLLIGPVLLCYINSAASSPKQIPRSWLAALVGILILILSAGILYPYAEFPDGWRNVVIPYIVYLIWTLSTILSVYIYCKNLAALKQNRLLTIVVFGNCLILASYLVSYADVLPGSYISGSIMYSLLFYISIFLLLERRKAQNVERYTNRKIPSGHAEKILAELEMLIVLDQLYLNPDLRLGDLAERLYITSHQLSQVLNDNFGTSFSDYINNYRVDAAAKLLVRSPHLRIEAIGYDVGFNSKSAFFAAFKKFKQVTPMKFRAASCT